MLKDAHRRTYLEVTRGKGLQEVRLRQKVRLSHKMSFGSTNRTPMMILASGVLRGVQIVLTRATDHEFS
jgi:hypothetical protein